MRLHSTINKVTGHTRYFANGIRVSAERFRFIEILADGADTIGAEENKRFTTHFKRVYGTALVILHEDKLS